MQKSPEALVMCLKSRFSRFQWIKKLSINFSPLHRICSFSFVCFATLIPCFPNKKSYFSKFKYLPSPAPSLPPLFFAPSTFPLIPLFCLFLSILFSSLLLLSILFSPSILPSPYSVLPPPFSPLPLVNPSPLSRYTSHSSHIRSIHLSLPSHS